MTTMSKAAFARHINVTRGRISQYLAEGTIGRDALQGEGRNAKVIVAKAIEQIRQRRDIGQALGNGLSTRLDLVEQEEAADDVGRPPKPTTVDDEIKQERLQSERRRNRVAALEEEAQLGRLVDAATVRAEMTKLAQAVDDENAGMLADFATSIAAQFGLPQRDVLHLLRRIRADKKAAAADRARRRAESLPERVSTIVESKGEA
ncbi:MULTISPECIES: hypothetical protein [unclassified Mesorhizobium]|uniref:hypothetical protein n=1 Tax=unclassified Mesorhizobium TaxID=325217 RepID=UPI0010921422|nr:MULTISPECIES: hypothetical protein [unclassified Mesorhizobium]TGQ01410.1 hypothetical protein EN861_01455 [Mesorhizobium sp. M8A.F.Ca.ET.218.01.1.1]TGT20682.1 hypothetical protein EN856_01455 [Mesorhizobium sp. M8A.F.Ca.ET.213.01.1.1]